jgi:hypothetical protein
VSKVEAQRAMRDARYAAYHAKLAADAKAAAGGNAASTRPAPAKASDAQAPAAAESAAPGEVADAGMLESEETTPVGSAEPELCGHQNIGNKACSRPAGHTEKNHRYR